MGVIDPLKVVIENYPEGKEEAFPAQVNPEDPSAGTRSVPFARVVYIERDDFMEDPPRRFRRLAPGREVRLRAACYITCTDVIKDENGEIVELRCTFDPESRGGSTPDGRKVRGTIHWVSAAHAVEAEVRLYDRLFNAENPMAAAESGDIGDTVNPNSLNVRHNCFVESTVRGAEPGSRYQFERLGYFCVDPDSSDERPVFNRTITLRDSWARMQKQKGESQQRPSGRLRSGQTAPAICTAESTDIEYQTTTPIRKTVWGVVVSGMVGERQKYCNFIAGAAHRFLSKGGGVWNRVPRAFSSAIHLSTCCRIS